MQTPQVNGPAGILSAPQQPGKQNAGNGAPGFDQALTREVAARREGDSPTRGGRQDAARGPANSPEAKPAEKSDEEASTEETTAAESPAGQFSADMLALVAAINSITNQDRSAVDGGDAAFEADTGKSDRAQAGLDALRATPTDGPADGAEQAVIMDSAESAQTGLGIRGDSKADDAKFIDSLQDTAGRINTAVPGVPTAALHAAQQMHGAAASEKLTPSVGTPAWDQALGQKVVWMVAGEQQSASLTLNPPDLGPLQVVLNVSNSQATATFSAAQPEVRQALEAALPKLREMLGEAGIQLGQASVNSGAPNQQGETGRQAGARGHHGSGDGGNAGDNEPRVTGVTRTSAGQGMVDTFV